MSSPPPPPHNTHTHTKGGGGAGDIVFGTDQVGVGVKRLVRSVTWIPFGIFWWYLVEMYVRTTCQIQDWKLWLSYFWSYHPLFYLKKSSCPLCNLNTLWSILMVLGRNVEQDQATCCVQEWHFCLSFFWRYLPSLYLTVIIHCFRVSFVSQRSFGIFLWYLLEM